MTFLEAAIEILRHSDGALHYSEVARRAVDENLLSHVGRDPEGAMQSCLNSAARTGRPGDDTVIIREKPGYYGIRPGAKLPASPPRPAPKPAPAPEPEPSVGREARNRRDSAGSEAKAKAKSNVTKTRKTPPSRRKRAKGEAPVPPTVEVVQMRRPIEKRTPAPEPEAPAVPRSEAKDRDIKPVEFEAPTGSGLEGVTDVALVMANAVSRLVEERPELKDELDAMQHSNDAPSNGELRIARAPSPAPAPASNGGSLAEDRGSRRRRRRRRRGKRVDWAGGTETRSPGQNLGDKLLDGVAAALEESGPRSLHVRQIAETLAARGVLGGEISEIERAVTAAILLDIRTRGRASRFAARGDARYQLQGARLPERAAKAEQALRESARVLETETRAQLVQWLQTLGARALESLVRIWLAQEGYALLSALPPGRGVGKLVVDDPEGGDGDDEGGRALVVVIPKRTQFETKLWEGEGERNGCASLILFAMGDAPDDGSLGDARVITPGELGQWLLQRGIGIDRMTIEVPVLDPTFVESVAGLDT